MFTGKDTHPQGKVVLDAKFSDIAPSRENDPRFFIGASGPYLSEGLMAKFVYYDKPYFALRDGQGKGPVFDLDTGKRKR
ncbi:hypothetical protein [Deinococcus sp. QL22]|uniref:hypothetical protein n=1 Tax=Deinococcus sp. QL22 TaxID=2939437 RepID=UPI002017EDB4|nr:hypothetical protein [Deinococcus sp. QL22]